MAGLEGGEIDQRGQNRIITRLCIVRFEASNEEMMVSQEGGKIMIELPRDLKDPLLPPWPHPAPSMACRS
jgi:hypothetical protein